MSKLHLKGKLKLHRHSKDRDKDEDKETHKHRHKPEVFHSEDAQRVRHDPNKRQGPQLIIDEAPKGPRFGGKGLKGNTTYDIQRSPEKQRPNSQPKGAPKLACQLVSSTSSNCIMACQRSLVASSACADTLPYFCCLKPRHQYDSLQYVADAVICILLWLQMRCVPCDLPYESLRHQ